jgi:hypothetical protein
LEGSLEPVVFYYHNFPLPELCAYVPLRAGIIPRLFPNTGEKHQRKCHSF